MVSTWHDSGQASEPGQSASRCHQQAGHLPAALASAPLRRPSSTQQQATARLQMRLGTRVHSSVAVPAHERLVPRLQLRPDKVVPALQACHRPAQRTLGAKTGQSACRARGRRHHAPAAALDPCAHSRVRTASTQPVRGGAPPALPELHQALFLASSHSLAPGSSLSSQCCPGGLLPGPCGRWEQRPRAEPASGPIAGCQAAWQGLLAAKGCSAAWQPLRALCILSAGLFVQGAALLSCVRSSSPMPGGWSYCMHLRTEALAGLQSSSECMCQKRSCRQPAVAGSRS